jgi:hypothetical protein
MARSFDEGGGRLERFALERGTAALQHIEANFCKRSKACIKHLQHTDITYISYMQHILLIKREAYLNLSSGEG